MGNKRNIKDIARGFENLLRIEFDKIDYELYADKEHGAGIYPLNEQTKKAIGKVSSKNYQSVLDELLALGKKVEHGQGYNLKRRQIFCE